MTEGRLLRREEIKKVWQIDRAELIEGIYILVDGKLSLQPEYYDAKGWPPGEAEKYTPILEACYDRGGWFYGLFEGQNPIGVVVLGNQFLGKNKDQLQLEFLHISRAYRDQGVGRQLFDLAAEEARRRGAKSLYISATPSEHTINFYLGLGCEVTPEPNPKLFELEPEDIHLVYDLHMKKSVLRA
jgi:predicted N-acetyltransferase YhbS